MVSFVEGMVKKGYHRYKIRDELVNRFQVKRSAAIRIVGIARARIMSLHNEPTDQLRGTVLGTLFEVVRNPRADPNAIVAACRQVAKMMALNKADPSMQPSDAVYEIRYKGLADLLDEEEAKRNGDILARDRPD